MNYYFVAPCGHNQYRTLPGNGPVCASRGAIARLVVKEGESVGDVFRGFLEARHGDYVGSCLQWDEYGNISAKVYADKAGWTARHYNKRTFFASEG